MADRVTTTQNYFPVEDITHRPKRMQKDNVAGSDAPVDSKQVTPDVPKMLTLERSITYYETHAEGQLKDLYKQTALWLRDLLDRSNPIKSAENIEDKGE